jgi:hypothetical protein
MKWKSGVLSSSVLLLLLMGARPTAVPAVRTVCASGCTYTNAQLQTAINASTANGDEILVQANFEYVGNYVLRANPFGTVVTLRTGVDASGATLSSALFPEANVRICPDDAGLDNDNAEICPIGKVGRTLTTSLARFKTAVNNLPAIRTVMPAETGSGCASSPCVGNSWKLQHIMIVPNTWAGTNMMELGSNRDQGDGLADIDGNPATLNGNPQNQMAEIPHGLVLEQVYFRGDPVEGQHRCLAVSAGIIIRGSHFKDCKTTWHDGQTMVLANVDGPVLIHNNHLEGSSEGIIAGGWDSEVRATTTVAASPAPTSTVFTLANATQAGLEPGVWVAIMHGGTELMRQVTAMAGHQITVTPALPAAAVAGSAVRWSLVMNDFEFTANRVLKPLRWRGPIVAKPAGVTATCHTTGGTLAAGTYSYRVAAMHRVANNEWPRSEASDPVSCTIATGSTGRVVLTWSAVTNVDTTHAGKYRVYGRTGSPTEGARNIRWEVTAPTVTYTDTGTAGTTDTAFTFNDDTQQWMNWSVPWSVKNNFELKMGRERVIVQGNDFDGAWTSGQDGMGILFSSLNDGGNHPSAVVSDVRFHHNVVRRMPGFFSLSATSTTSTPSGISENMSIRHNLVYDILGGTSGYGNVLHAFVFGGGEFSGLPGTIQTNGVTIDRNTIILSPTDSGRIMSLQVHLTGIQKTIENLKVTNNILHRGSEGLRGLTPNYTSEGLPSWTPSVSGDSDYIWNYQGNGPTGCTGYPTGNTCVDQATFQAAFTNFATKNFAVPGGSALLTASSSGGLLGADLTTTLALQARALSGDDRAAPVTIPADLPVPTDPPSGGGGGSSSTWGNLINVSTSAFGVGNGRVRKTGGDVTSFDASALSTASMAGDGYVEFTRDTSGTIRAGLGTDAGTGADNVNHIPWAIHCTAGFCDLHDAVNGYLLEFASVAGDTFRFTRTGTSLVVTQNGSTLTPGGAGWSSIAGSLWVDVAIREGNEGITVTALNGFAGGGGGGGTVLDITTPSPLPDGTQNIAYQGLTLAVTGGSAPYTWAVSAGALPTGLSLNTSTGAITGTPSAVVTNQSVTFLVTDAGGANTSEAFTITIAPGATPLVFASPLFLPSGMVNRSYSYQLTAAGGSPPYVWERTSGTLPTGLSFNATTGVLSGVPTVAVSSRNITFKVTDAAGAIKSGVFNVRINRPGPRRSSYDGNEARHYRRPEPPTAEDEVFHGDLWSDTDASPVQVYVATVTGVCPASCTITWTVWGGN